MPLVVMGILPLIVAFILGNGFLFSFGLLFTWGATGDLSILFMLRKLDKECFVSDHPEKIGFYCEMQGEEVIEPILNKDLKRKTREINSKTASL